MMTRTAAGFATAAFVGFGALVAAPAALADGGAPASPPVEAPKTAKPELPAPDGGKDESPEKADSGVQTKQKDGKEVSTEYRCTFKGQSVDGGNIKLVLNTPPAGETGSPVAMELSEFEARWYYSGGSKPAAEKVSAKVDFKTSGAAAPASTASVSGAGAKYTNGALEFGPITGSVTPKKPGELKFAPGTITVTVKGDGSTVCKPIGGSVFHTVNVTGDPIETPDPEPTPTKEPEPTKTAEPSPTAEPTEGDDKPTPTAKPTDDGGSAGGGDGDSSLPVTGTALGGLVAAAAVAVGGGGAAMYLARRRKTGAVDNES